MYQNKEKLAYKQEVILQQTLLEQQLHALLHNKEQVRQELKIKEVLPNLALKWVCLEVIQANEIVLLEVIQNQEVQVLEAQEEDKS